MPRNSRVPNTGYYNASDECWSLFTEVIGAEFSNAVLFGQVHQLTVDAYASQHAGGPHPDKSVAVHLSGLYLALERGIPPTSIAPLLQQLATRVHEWPHFEPPSITWPHTIFDVAISGDHITAVREWSAGVWAGWGREQEAVASFVGSSGMHLTVSAAEAAEILPAGLHHADDHRVRRR